ncbi:MAG TPA: cytochrome c-type biogenesis protein CcmH [Chloroflexota bacterium]|nr:cytochrome c-type biogenesis protein CcmH [Chloroflexota bacterium]HUM68335.1 cytochrome c-type biogenesis protein CcmH [Chloroflexota bacterium]
MKNGLLLTVYCLLLTLFLFTVGIAAAQTGEVSDDEVNAVAKDLFCPVCESTPLDVCPTKACADWRELIRVQLAQGKSRAEIHDYFARQYGDGVLADPPKRGFSLILWLLPVLGVAVGGVLFVRYVRHLRRAGETVVATAVAPSAPSPFSAAAAPQPATPLEASGDYVARVEEELLARK